MTSTQDQLQKTVNVLNLIFVLGFLGIVWLIIYGNLSGNLGFTQDSETTSVQELTLDNITAVTFTGTSGKTNPSVSNIVVINATGGEIITAGNYTLTDTTIIGSATMTLAYNGTAVNVSYITNFDSSGQIDSNAVIGNITSGAVAFYGFSGTWFTITAVAVLIVILIGILALVLNIINIGKKKDSFE